MNENLSPPEFDVICLCAAWCGSCRAYRPKFERLALDYPSVRFSWVDIEESAESLGDLDIEDFPTLLIRRQSSILYFSRIDSRESYLRRLLAHFMAQSADQAKVYARSNSERQSWQENAALVDLCANPLLPIARCPPLFPR